MDESAEEVATAQALGPGRLIDKGRVTAVRWQELERAVRSVLVVMPAIDAKHVL